jgi:cytochrome c oxidase cbb3-type subunit 3
LRLRPATDFFDIAEVIMRMIPSLAEGACLLALSIAAVPPVAQGQGRGGGRGPATFPAQQRPPGDAASIARGRVLYEGACRFCHGADLRGGDGGSNLLRSQLVLNDQNGELIGPVIRGGSQTPGVGSMPAFSSMPDTDIKALADFLHSIQALMRGQGNPPAETAGELNVLVGDAAAGQAYFNSTCTSCHTAADMKGIATRTPDPKDLQNYWLRGSMGGRGSRQSPTKVTVTTTAGEPYQGEVVRYDDFIVILTQEDGTRRSFRRNGADPKVVIDDPRTAHLQLLPKYSDKNIHDVTAYLVTLK